MSGNKAAGRAVIWLFCAVVAGVNAPNALVPLYVDAYGLPPDGQALLLSIYMAALVGSLLILARNPRRGGLAGARLILLAGAGVSIASDLLLALGSAGFGFILAGRVMGGLAMALGTSAAAELALGLLGERARTTVGTVTVLGSLAGNLGGGVVVSLGIVPLVLVPAGHAAITVLLLIAAGVATHASRIRPAVRASQTAGGMEVPVYTTRHRLAGYTVGALSWSVAGLVLALVPAAVRSAHPGSTAVQYMLPSAALLGCAWLAQRASARRLHRLRAWAVSTGMVTGTVLLALALQNGSTWLITAACAVLGITQGPAYTLGLVTVTNRLAPSRQATAASGYAAWTYSSCAVGVLLVGVLAARVGVPSSLETAALLLAGAGVAAALLAGRPWWAELADGLGEGHKAT